MSVRSAISFDSDRARAAAITGQQAKREKQRLARQELRRDFADDGAWMELARPRGLRLPIWTSRITTGGMRNWLRRLGISVARYTDWYGGGNLGDFAKRNPDWPLRAWVGLMLEMADDDGFLKSQGGEP
jgi:hypothetical protein